MRSICSKIVLLLVIPATNATSERTFSALRRVKTYLQSTMRQSRLNSLMTLHVHMDRTDALDLKEIANEFTARNEQHRCVWKVLIISHVILSVKFKLCVTSN